jgi:hypothetical protein
MNVRKLMWWAVVVFVAWFIFTQPAAAAGAFHTIMGALSSAASSAATFVSSVAG